VSLQRRGGPRDRGVQGEATDVEPRLVVAFVLPTDAATISAAELPISRRNQPFSGSHRSFILKTEGLSVSTWEGMSCTSPVFL